MKSNNKLQNIILLTALFFLGVSTANARQNISAAALRGTTSDTNSTAVKGAAVVAANLETNQTRTAVSDKNGRFRFTYLPVGNYEITVQASGFAALRQKFTASVGQALEIKLGLKIKEVSAQVEISGNETIIETNRTQIAGTILPKTSIRRFAGKLYFDLCFAPAV